MAQKILNLRCACCGGKAPAFKQWHNQDKGYGLCPKCATYIESRAAEKPNMFPGRNGLSYVVVTYGHYGVHHSIDLEDYK